jgi:hypothetical protein
VLAFLFVVFGVEETAVIIHGTGPGVGTGFEEHHVGQGRLADGAVTDESQVPNLLDRKSGHARVA